MDFCSSQTAKVSYIHHSARLPYHTVMTFLEWPWHGNRFRSSPVRRFTVTAGDSLDFIAFGRCCQPSTSIRNMAINADSDLTEHAAGIAQPLDTPFPYTDVQPSSSAPISSKERSLAFLLHSTRTTSVQELEIRSRTLQENAYAIWPYPCIRRWSFLT